MREVRGSAYRPFGSGGIAKFMSQCSIKEIPTEREWGEGGGEEVEEGSRRISSQQLDLACPLTSAGASWSSVRARTEERGRLQQAAFSTQVDPGRRRLERERQRHRERETGRQLLD